MKKPTKENKETQTLIFGVAYLILIFLLITPQHPKQELDLVNENRKVVGVFNLSQNIGDTFNESLYRGTSKYRLSLKKPNGEVDITLVGAHMDEKDLQYVYNTYNKIKPSLLIGLNSIKITDYYLFKNETGIGYSEWLGNYDQWGHIGIYNYYNLKQENNFEVVLCHELLHHKLRNLLLNHTITLEQDEATVLAFEDSGVCYND